MVEATADKIVGAAVDDDLVEAAAVDQGARMVYEVLAEALLNVPCEQVLSDVRNMAHAFGANGFNDAVANAELEQCYYNRMFVASHPRYVALTESVVVPAGVVDGRVEYGSPAQGRLAQVVACYKEVGFDHRELAGLSLAVQSLKADSLASELAFMAFLHHGAAEAAGKGNVVETRTYHRLALHFLEQHLGAWAEKAARLAAAGGDDFYSHLCSFAAQWVQSDHDQLASSAD